MKYIIIYNAETDFILVFTKAQATEQIEELINNGYAKDDITLYEAREIEFYCEGDITVIIP